MIDRRAFNSLCGLTLLAPLAGGCASMTGRRDEIPSQHVSADQIIEHLNQNARQIRSIDCSNVSITAKQGMQTIGLSGDLAFQKPRNFRLKANAVNTTQADFGSNDREFWFWIKKSEQPYLFHCSYEDLPRAQNIPIPIQPDWVAEALGATELGDPSQYKLNDKGRFIELVSQTTSPQGQPVRKITTIERSTGHISRLELLSKDNQPIWVAYIDEYHKKLPGGNYTIPRIVRLVSPKDKTEMRLKLDGCQVNTLAASSELFAIPNMPGVQMYNLARGRINGSPASLQQVRGRIE